MNETQHQAKVVIIGTEGAGKTVFISCFAKCFEGSGKNGCVLEPMTKETPLYVDENWRALQNGDWPPATNAGLFMNLQWQLRIAGGNGSQEDIYALWVVDCAGHDLRGFFADGKIANAGTLPDVLQPLVAHCREADIVLLLVNLNDFKADTLLAQTTANQWAIKYALDYKLASKPTAKCALIFTQSDTHQGLLNQFGNWPAVGEKYLPHVHGAYLRNGKVPIFAVSAVNKTHPMMLPGGVTRLVPADGFGHDGFDELIGWIANQAKTVAEVHHVEENDNEKTALKSRIADVDQKISEINRAIKAKEVAAQAASFKNSIAPTAIASILIFLLLVFALPRRPVPFPPISWGWTVTEGGIGYNDDIVISNNNDYPWTNVRVRFTQPGTSNDTGTFNIGQIQAGHRNTIPQAYNFHQDENLYKGAIDCDQNNAIQTTEIIWANVFLWQFIASGFLYGIFYYKFYMPQTMAEDRQLAELATNRRHLERQLREINLQPQRNSNQDGEKPMKPSHSPPKKVKL